MYHPWESQPHKGHLTSKPNYTGGFRLTFSVPFYYITFSSFTNSPVHPTWFSFCFFPGFLAILTLLSSNNKVSPQLAIKHDKAASNHDKQLATDQLLVRHKQSATRPMVVERPDNIFWN